MSARGGRGPSWAWLVVLTCACQPVDPTKPPPPRYRLEGSLTQLIDLGYDEARLVFAEDRSDFSLVFIRKRPVGLVPEDGGADAPSEDVTFQLTYALLGEEFPPPAPAEPRVDLAVQLDPTADGGVQRGVASRNVLNDPRKLFPRLQRGTINTPGTLAAGSMSSGDFHVTFENGIEVASGRTVFGRFSAQVTP